MIVSERGLIPSFLSPKRWSEPRIIIVCASPACARSISGMLIGARPSFSIVLMSVSACRKPAAETLPAASRTIRRPQMAPRLSRPAPTLGGGFRGAHESPPSTARNPSPGRSRPSGRWRMKSPSAWR